MTAGTDESEPPPVRVELLHHAHPKIRAMDWRSPLVARLIDDAPYSDGRASVNASYRPKTGPETISELTLEWSALKPDYEQCLRTYQTPVITEFAALAIACVLCERKANVEITEVTRRGERVDYWVGDRELLLEVSGTKGGSIDDLCESKGTEQLQKNPFMKDGFVCAARFESAEARLWFYPYPTT
jgi:hypothetical protein